MDARFDINERFYRGHKSGKPHMWNPEKNCPAVAFFYDSHGLSCDRSYTRSSEECCSYLRDSWLARGNDLIAAVSIGFNDLVKEGVIAKWEPVHDNCYHSVLTHPEKPSLDRKQQVNLVTHCKVHFYN